MKTKLFLLMSLFMTNALAQEGKIYFTSNNGVINSGDTPEMMVYDFATGETTRFKKASVAGHGEGSVAISPKGKKVIFNTYQFSGWKLAIGNLKEGKISNIQRFTDRSNYEYEAEWSSDGKSVVYQEYNWSSDKTEIFVRDLVSGSTKKVTNAVTADRTPRWADNNSKIIFTGARNASYDIHSVSIDGSGFKTLTQSRAHDFAPSVNPVQDKIAFLSNRTGKIHLYVMSSDGSNKVNLTPELASQPLTGNTWQNTKSWAYHTSWSPDGNWLTFNAPINGNTEVFIVKEDGSELRQLTDNNKAEMTPYWSKY